MMPLIQEQKRCKFGKASSRYILRETKEEAMPAAKYIVELSAEERDQILAIIRRGKTLTRKITRARILLKAEQRLTDEQIASELGIGSATVGRVRQRFVEEGLENALNE